MCKQRLKSFSVVVLAKSLRVQLCFFPDKYFLAKGVFTNVLMTHHARLEYTVYQCLGTCELSPNIPGNVGIVSDLDVREHVGVLSGTDYLHGSHRAASLQVAKIQAPASMDVELNIIT